MTSTSYMEKQSNELLHTIAKGELLDYDIRIHAELELLRRVGGERAHGQNEARK